MFCAITSFNIYFKQINPSVINYICDDCKEQLVQFYLFKENSKQNLQASFFENAVTEMLEFFTKNKDRENNFELEFTENEFVVRVKSQQEADPTPYEQMYIDSDHEFIEETEEKFYAEVQDENDQIIQDSLLEETEVLIKNEEVHTEIKIVDDNFVTDKVYTCECGSDFTSVKDFQEHKSIYHKRRSAQSAQNLPFSCDFCGIVFRDEKYAKMHEKAHESFEAILPQMPIFQCGECQILFSNEDDLMTHTTLHESKIENLEDSLIERISAFEGHFYKSDKPLPEEDYVSDEILMSCGHCGVKKSEYYIRMHLLFFHTNVVYCPLDNRCFEGHKQIRQFPEHVKTKHPEIFDKKVEFICSCCSEKFATQFEKLAHMKTCDMKKYICEGHCGKRFKSEWLLNKHLKLIEVGGDKRFTCSLCPKQCVSKSDLQIHMRSHTNERPYECK